MHVAFYCKIEIMMLKRKKLQIHLTPLPRESKKKKKKNYTLEAGPIIDYKSKI